MTYRFSYRRYSLPFQRPVRTAHGVWTEREGLILRLEDEQQRVRFSEVAPIVWFGTESVEQAETVCRDFGESVTDEKIAAVPAQLGCLRSALRAAADHVESPDVTNEPRAFFPVATLLPAGRAALAQIGPKGDAAFRTFKWKVGVGDIADELALLDDVVGELPSGARLRLDANGAWDRRKAERWLERCADRPVEFVEQPIAADARGAEDLLLGLAGDYPTPIGLDESVTRAADVSRWLGLGWRGVFVVKPALLDDVAGALGQLQKAKANVVFSSALETAVGAKAALRAAFAYQGEPRALGFGVWPLFADARFDGPHLAPAVRASDVEAINEEAVWNALS